MFERIRYKWYVFNRDFYTRAERLIRSDDPASTVRLNRLLNNQNWFTLNGIASMRAVTAHGNGLMNLAVQLSKADKVEVILKNFAFRRSSSSMYGRSFIEACRIGNQKVLDVFFKYIPGNLICIDSNKPLRVAAETGNLELFKKLMQYTWVRKAITSKNFDALYQAVKGGHIDIVREILKNKDDTLQGLLGIKSCYILCAAIESGSIEMFNLLSGNVIFQQNIEAYREEALLIAIRRQDIQMVKMLLGADKSWKDFGRNYGNTEVIVGDHNRGTYERVDKQFFKQFMNISSEREYSFLYNCWQIISNKGGARLEGLLGENFAHRWYRRQLSRAMCRGMSSDSVSKILTVAASIGNLEILEALFSSKIFANNFAVDGSIPLEVACANGHIEVVRFILKKYNSWFRESKGSIKDIIARSGAAIRAALESNNPGIALLMLEYSTGIQVEISSCYKDEILQLADKYMNYYFEQTSDQSSKDEYLKFIQVLNNIDEDHSVQVEMRKAKRAALQQAKAIIKHNTPASVGELKERLQKKRFRFFSKKKLQLTESDYFELVDYAISLRKYKKLAILLENHNFAGLDVNKKGELFVKACKIGDDNVLNVYFKLADKGTFSVNGNKPLQVAAEQGNIKLLKSLLKDYKVRKLLSDGSLKPLLYAVKNGNIECAKEILKIKYVAEWAGKNAGNIFGAALESRSSNMIKMLTGISSFYKYIEVFREEALLTAIKNKNLEQVKVLTGIDNHWLKLCQICNDDIVPEAEGADSGLGSKVAKTTTAFWIFKKKKEISALLGLTSSFSFADLLNISLEEFLKNNQVLEFTKSAFYKLLHPKLAHKFRRKLFAVSLFSNMDSEYIAKILDTAAEVGDVKILEVLFKRRRVRKHVFVGSGSPLEIACKNGNIGAAMLIMQQYNSLPKFMTMFKNDRTDIAARHNAAIVAGIENDHPEIALKVMNYCTAVQLTLAEDDNKILKLVSDKIADYYKNGTVTDAKKVKLEQYIKVMETLLSNEAVVCKLKHQMDRGVKIGDIPAFESLAGFTSDNNAFDFAPIEFINNRLAKDELSFLSTASTKLLDYLPANPIFG